VVLDELSHSCMFAGAQLSGARVETFRHNDAAHAEEVLAGKREGRALLLTETVFSMDGDRAPLGDLADACERHGAWMMTDDAHGFGVVHQHNPAPIQMGTLSKAVGSYGGYVCGPRALIDLLVNRARGLIYTTGLPPAALGAALAALDIIESEPGRGEAALANAAAFCTAIGAAEPQSAVVPVVLGEARAALDASQRLLGAGLLVTAIRYPTVPEGTARLRVSFSATHERGDVERLGAEVLAIMDGVG
jgi:8-amino-7-oxononanoate synthase